MQFQMNLIKKVRKISMSNQRKEFYIPTLSDDKKELEKENDQASSMTSKEAKEENIKNAPDVFVSPFLITEQFCL